MWSLYQLLVNAVDHNGENSMLTTVLTTPNWTKVTQNKFFCCCINKRGQAVTWKIWNSPWDYSQVCSLLIYHKYSFMKCINFCNLSAQFAQKNSAKKVFTGGSARATFYRMALSLFSPTTTNQVFLTIFFLWSSSLFIRVSSAFYSLDGCLTNWGRLPHFLLNYWHSQSDFYTLIFAHYI